RVGGRSREDAGVPPPRRLTRHLKDSCMIVVIAEQRSGKLNRATWEAIAAAQELANGGPITTLALGTQIGGVAAELAGAGVHAVATIDHPALAWYTPDGYTAALEKAIAGLSPSIVAMPHTYQARDLAPK